MSRRVGVLGGTFDPIHLGHLDVAAAAHAALALDRVLLVPSRQPPHRAAAQASPFHRFAMTALAAATQPYLEASDLELQSASGPSYTIDTLRRLHGAGFTPIELFFIIGSDAFAEIETWKAYPQLFEAAHFLVISRPGQPAEAMRARVPALASHMREAAAGIADRLPSIVLIEAPTCDVSSTTIREIRQRGGSIAGLVAAPVDAHIQRHRLYRDH